MNSRLQLAWLCGMVTAILATPVCVADDIVVLDGLGGRSMRAEAAELRRAGHEVVYRRWWAWRSAARAADQPVHVIGYSLGGSRASRAAERLDVSHLELIDPVHLRRAIELPGGVNTTVYRAGRRSVIRSSAVIGEHREVVVQANHVQMPRNYRR
jgi:pimeloyl-ACP methyl ester carboxylesterase